QAEDGIRDRNVTGVQTCALPIFLLTTIKKPIDWTFLISFAMFLIKFIEEIISDDFFWMPFTTKSISNKFQIFLQRIFTINYFYKIYKTINNIIIKILIITNRDNTIFISRKSSIFRIVPVTTSISKTINI